MNQYQWCICDMDGTLLNSKNIITEENVTALKKLQQQGTEVMIASGRTDLMIKKYIKQLDLRGHVISCNGGLIRNITTDEIVYSRPMDKSTVKEILSYCNKESINYLVYTPNIVFSNKNNPRTAIYEKLNQEQEVELRFQIQYIDNADMKAMEDMDILKVLLISEDDDQVEYLLNKFTKFMELSAVISGKGMLDIMASNTSKGNAVKFLAEKTGVNLDYVIAFGDNYNDMEMLQNVGMPIAVENAVEPLKAVAKYITKSNDESGIAYAIHQYIHII